MAEGSSRMTEGMLSLSWNNHSAAFTQTLATLREKEIYTDVTLACGGKFYPVHKLVLSTCSDYFLQMFERTSCKHPIIILKDVQCREMEALLSYMYEGIVCVPQSDLTQLIMVAEALQIKGLAVPDETMCTNNRLSYTWSPTDDRISPHAKRLRHGDNGAGVFYPRYPDNLKPKTLTGIPSFSSVPPQTLNSTPSVPSIGKHVQHNVRPSYTTVRYSPYSRESERQQASPKQIQTISMKEFLGMFKSDQKQSDLKLPGSQNASEGTTTSQMDTCSTFADNDKEIIPEAMVKVEVEEGTEPVHVEDLAEPPCSDAEASHVHSQHTGELLKSEPSTGEGEKGESSREISEASTSKAFDKSSDAGNTFTKSSSGDSHSQNVKVEKPDVPSVSSSNREASENTPPKTNVQDGTSNWAEDEDSSHPLDLSDAQKYSQMVSAEKEYSRMFKQLYNVKLGKYSCPHCSYKTTHSATLTKHLRMHTLETPYSCPYCPFRAFLHAHLQEHMNTHKGGSEGGH
ncbi:zinc finger protein 236-like [Macrobrachium nipponense]|uniref:zinc finger protein 236-like n=1 Tax=Macrobrachium nipponense TaxID=159736 RepID=UPI0030C7F410